MGSGSGTASQRKKPVSLFFSARCAPVGGQVYATLTAAQIISKVANEGLRPPVPKACPWAAVMQACWRQDPEQRPPFSEILPELQRIEQTLRPGGGATPPMEVPWAAGASPGPPSGGVGSGARCSSSSGSRCALRSLRCP